MNRKLAIFLLIATALGLADAPAEAADDQASAPTAHEQRVAAYLDRVIAQRADSPDLRMRIVYTPSHGLVRSDGNRGTTGEGAPAIDLHELARGSTDPLVLEMLLRHCSTTEAERHRCDRLELARRWVAVDAQNQVAWVALAAVQRKAGRQDEASATFERASLAPAWREHQRDVGRMLLAAPVEAGDLDERAAILFDDLPRTFASVDGFADAQAFVGFCKDARHRPACTRIIDTMVRDTDSLLTLKIAVSAASRAGVEASIVDGYQQRFDALNAASLLTVPRVDDLDRMDAAARQQVLADLEERLRKGERGYLEDRLTAAHLDTRSAAALYVASLTDEQREARRRWRDPPR